MIIVSNHPPAGGELDPSTVRIDGPAGTLGYAWYQTQNKAYYCMGIGNGIPLDGGKTNTYKPASGFTGTTAEAFLSWAAGKLGIAESKVEKQFIQISYSPWP